MNLNMDERVDLYNQKFLEYPSLRVEDGWIIGYWLIGNYYQNDRDYYGEYPHSYLDRVTSMFPDASDVMHLFSGTLNESNVDGLCVDINPNVNPDVVADAENLPFDDNSFDIVYADPPYTEEDAQKYGTSPVNRNEVILNQLPSVVKSGGFVVWLDQILPMYRSDDWNWIGTIGLARSTNHRFRTVCIFRRK